MAARLSPKHDERTREKIKASQLINVLQSFALGENDPRTGKPVVIHKDRITAIDILLRKVVPNVSSIEMAGSGGGPLVIEIRKLAPDVPPDA